MYQKDASTASAKKNTCDAHPTAFPDIMWQTAFGQLLISKISDNPDPVINDPKLPRKLMRV